MIYYWSIGVVEYWSAGREKRQGSIEVMGDGIEDRGQRLEVRRQMTEVKSSICRIVKWL